MHVQTKVGETPSSSDTGHGRLLPCVAPSTPAWMTHAIRGTEPAVPMLTRPRGSATVAVTGRTPDTDPATRFGGQNPELAEPAVSD